MGKEWRLESLTIGPLTHKTDDLFWHDAFLDFPAVPCLDDVTIVCYYPNANAFDTSTWDYFKTFFDRTDIFPPTMQMDLRMRIGSELPGYNQRLSLNSQLSSLRSHRLVTLNGHREWVSFWMAASLISRCYARLLVPNGGVNIMTAALVCRYCLTPIVYISLIRK